MTSTRTSLPRCNAIGCARPANGYCAEHQPYGPERVARSVRPGDTEASCDHCRYFTGHTSWCPVTKAATRTVTLRTHAGAYRRNQIPANTHVLANELPGVAVGTACGRVFGFATTSGLTVDAEPRPVTCSACRSAS